LDKLTKLPAELRRIAEEICEEGHAGWPNGLSDIADQLEDALPTWTTITADPDTWPEDGQDVLICEWSAMLKDWCAPEMNGFGYAMFTPDNISLFIGNKWRKLGLIDRPPEYTK